MVKKLGHEIKRVTAEFGEFVGVLSGMDGLVPELFVDNVDYHLMLSKFKSGNQDFKNGTWKDVMKLLTLVKKQ